MGERIGSATNRPHVRGRVWRILAWAVLCAPFTEPAGVLALQTEPPTGHPYDDAQVFSLGDLSPAAQLPLPPAGGLFRLANEATPTGLTEHVRPLAVSHVRLERHSGSWPRWGTAVGGVIGFVTTYAVLNSGVESTQLCNQAANQDAIETRYCVGLYILGGLAGAGVGWLLSEWILGSGM